MGPQSTLHNGPAPLKSPKGHSCTYHWGPAADAGDFRMFPWRRKLASASVPGVLRDLNEIEAGLYARNISAVKSVLLTVAGSSNLTGEEVDEILDGVNDIVNDTLEPSVKTDFSIAQDQMDGFWAVAWQTFCVFDSRVPVILPLSSTL